MARKKLSTIQLIEMYIRHVSYEIVMLKDLEYLFFKDYIQRSNPLRSALIESCALHIRNLFDFFLARYYYQNGINKREPRHNDSLAEDFLDECNLSDWHSFLKGLIDGSEILEIKERVNKEVAHLTYGRLKVKHKLKGWQEEFAIGYDYIFKLQCKLFELMPDSLESQIKSKIIFY